ncbi:SHOCT domain-containing protein [Myxococcaceae bacterium JPH2]|nr:SHOCT domain-containing protein [Myxococcaceae bacterium JPH2]
MSDMTVLTRWLTFGAYLGLGLAVYGFLRAKGGLLGADARLREEGTPAQATVLEMKDTALRINRAHVYSILLEVRMEGRAPYQVRTRTRLIGMSGMAVWGPGLEVNVKVDPKDPQRLVILGPTQPIDLARALGAAAQPQDPVRAMADLQRLSDAGLISPSEFEAKRAEILGRL